MPPTLGARSGRVRGVSGVCVWLLLIFEDSWVHMGSSCGVVLLKVWHFPEVTTHLIIHTTVGRVQQQVFF